VIEDPDDPGDDASDEVPDPVICAACGSIDIDRTPRLVMFAVIGSSILAVGVAIDQNEAAFFATTALAIYLLVLGRWRCNECGNTWN
jgi:hypothetical protein